MKIIDARNLACPQPVLLTKKAIEEGEAEFEVWVSDDIPKENVKKFCKSQACEIVETRSDGGWRLVVRQGEKKGQIAKITDKPQEFESLSPNSKYVLLITTHKIGENEELGSILMEGFINTLPSASRKPSRLLFMNEGVFLTTENSSVLKALQSLEAMGVEIYSCGTCLDFYKLKDKLQVGMITNMYDTVEALTGGNLVVKV